MIKQTITVNHKKYATGLFWQPLGVGITAHSYAKQLSKNTDKKYNLFTEYKSMIGLTNSRDGARVGMISAAVEIINSLSELVSFLGVFRAGNYFYLVAVRNGIIIRDVLIENENIIKEEINKYKPKELVVKVFLDFDDAAHRYKITTAFCCLLCLSPKKRLFF